MNQMLDFQFTNGHWSPRRPHWYQEALSFGWSVCNELLKFRMAEYSASHCKSLAAVSGPQLRMLANARSSTFVRRWMTHPEWLFVFLFWPMWFCLSSQWKSYNKSDDECLTPQMLPLILLFLQLRLCLQPTENKHKRSVLRLSMSCLLHYSRQPSLCIFVPSNEVTDFIMEQQWP